MNYGSPLCKEVTLHPPTFHTAAALQKILSAKIYMTIPFNRDHISLPPGVVIVEGNSCINIYDITGKMLHHHQSTFSRQIK